MVDAMAEIAEDTDNNGLVQRARTDAGALGRLYELYYERICIGSLLRNLDTDTVMILIRLIG